MDLRKTADNVEALLGQHGIKVRKTSVHDKEFSIIVHLVDGKLVTLDISKMISEGVQSLVDGMVKSHIKSTVKVTKTASKSDK